MDSYSQYGEDKIIETYFPGKTNGVYIDIGAGEPKTFSNTYAFYKMGWNGLLVEPYPEYYNKLKETRTHDAVIPYAISDHNGKINMFKTVTAESDVGEYYKEKFPEEKFEVECMTMNRLINDYPRYIEPDFISIDIESGEEKLLSQCNFEIFKPKLIVIEHWFRGKDRKGKTIERMNYRPVWEHYLLPYYEFMSNTEGNSIYKRREKTKLHIACGDIYLKGYINIDIQGMFACNLGNINNPNSTTLDKYFIHPFGGGRSIIIVDKKMDLLETWDFKDNFVDEIVMISAIEHFTHKQGKFIISEIKRILKPNGRLIIDFPDIKKDVELYYDNDANFMSELILCNHKNNYSIHRYIYTPKSFTKLLGSGWKEINKDVFVTHEYPMLSFTAIKE